MKTAAGSVVFGPLLLLSACRPAPVVTPEVSAAAEAQDPLAIADVVEAAVDAGTATPARRQGAYDQVFAMTVGADKAAELALAKAMVAARLAEARGAAGLRFAKIAEVAARDSIALDPKLRDGAARGLLGALYVHAPAGTLRGGNSEQGLAMLKSLVQEFPDSRSAHLRLADAYVALGDDEGAYTSLCRLQPAQPELRPSERALFDELVEVTGGPETWECP